MLKKNLIRGISLASAFYIILIISAFVLNILFPLNIPNDYSTIVLSSDSTVMHAFLSKDDKWRMYSELNEISPNLKKAIIHKEDKYFYRHPGINPFSIIRAMFNNILNLKRTSGASTITMQVARLLNPKKRTYLNKIIEIARAIQLEWTFTKDEILLLYLNRVPYGGNIEGVKSASVLYFNKKPYLLSIAEITTLAIIPNRPNSLTIGKDNNYIIAERNKWLKRFDNENVFTTQEINDATNEPLTATRLSPPKLAPHLSIRMKNLYPTHKIIYTNIELKKQLETENFVTNYIKRLYSKNIKNAVVLITENKTHKVITYIGSADFYNPEDGGQVDGVRAIRSPGSTLKPILYGVAIDKGIITPKYVIADVPVNYAGYAPENYDDKFNGNVTVEYALSHSLNVPAVKILDEIGIENFLHILKNAGYKKITADKSKLGLSLILGGCGVTLEELTKTFSAIANKGQLYELAYCKEDTILFHTNILSPESSFLITEILTQVTRPDLPLQWQNSENIPKIAWKTGTSYGRKDAWSIGYNEKYTIGVWVGNFDAQTVPALSGTEFAAPLLFNIFNSLEYKTNTQWFQQDNNLDFRKVCSETGKIPSQNCENLILDYYIPAVSSVEVCNHIKEIYINTDSTIAYCNSCLPENNYIKALYKNYPPDIISYFDKYQIKYQQIPQHNPNCERIFNDNIPKITSPIDNVEYLIDKMDSTKIMLSCDVANDVNKIFWYINDKYIADTKPNQKLFITPPAGKVKISCTDDKARNSNILINVKYIYY